MLYDEEGRAYVEPALLPEDVHVLSIVRDYQRMFNVNRKLENRNRELRESIQRVNGLQFAQHRIIVEQKKMMDHLMELLKKNGIPVPPYIADFKALKTLTKQKKS